MQFTDEHERRLARFPVCTRRVAIAGPAVGDDEPRGDVVVETTEFLKRLQVALRRDIDFDGSDEFAAAALPVWLERAKLDVDTVTAVPKPLSSVLWLINVEGLIRDSVAEVFCPDCGRYSAEVRLSTEGREETHSWLRGTRIWRCMQGHTLYRENIELHIMRRAGC